MNRREFVKRTAMAAAISTALPGKSFGRIGANDKVRLGFIGTGLRGQDHIELALQRTDVEIVAICDIQQVMIDGALELFKKSDKPFPKIFTAGKEDYKNLLALKDIDAVIIATPWEWHYPMAIDAMQAGKHVGCEVIAATTIEELWALVRIAERTGMQYMVLENVCYRRDVMAALYMLRMGMFGELIHMQGGYQHDLRKVKFNDGKQPYGGGVEFGDKGFSEAQWRTHHSLHRNGDLYPTHGIGPLAMMSNINRGNRFTSLVSYASKSRGLHEYIVANGGEQHANAKLKWKLGDVVTTMLATANGETILLQHDTSLPRPYSLGFRVQGTKGMWMDVNKSLHIEGLSPEHKWEEAATYFEKYDHPFWQKYASDAAGAGHGGMDFFVLHEFVMALRHNRSVPLDVYDAATWTAITPLSEKSIAKGGANVDFPDFLAGRWKTRKNTFAEYIN